MSKILVVEDQSDIRRLIRWALEFEDHEIREAPNGDQGLSMALAWKPDLILLDVMMPGSMDGFEVCRRVKADRDLSSTPVVLLSARAQQGDRRAGSDAGADEYIVKPFSPLELTDVIESLLKKSQAAS
jgi:DNA-binding response OmpR family regulator